MTWDVFLGIVALTGFVISIGRIVSMNTKAMQKLEDSIVRLDETIREEKKDINELVEHLTKIDNSKCTNEIKAKTDGTINQSLMLAVTGLVELVDGRPMNAVALEAFARKLPLMDANYLLNKAGKIEDSFGLNLNVECDCPHCKLHSVAPFRISSEFFRPKVD